MISDSSNPFPGITNYRIVEIDAHEAIPNPDRSLLDYAVSLECFNIIHDSRVGEANFLDITNATVLRARDSAKIRQFSQHSWELVGAFIAQNPTLEEINFNSCGITADSLDWIFTSNVPSLVSLDLWGNKLTTEGMEKIKKLMQGKHIRKLRLSGIMPLGGTAECVCSMLNTIKIDEFDVAGYGISDETIDHLLSASNARFLKALRVHRQMEMNRFGPDGLRSIFSFLQRDDIIIEEFALTGVGIPFSIELIEYVLQSLAKTNSVRKVDIPFHWIPLHWPNRKIADAVNLFMRTVCNTTTLEAITQSNHSLAEFCCIDNKFDEMLERRMRYIHDAPPPLSATTRARLRLLMQINEGGHDHSMTINEKIRFKLREFYFSDPEFDLTPFLAMEPTLVPHLLEFAPSSQRFVDGNAVVTRAGRLNNVYKLIRNWNLPTLLGSPSPGPALKSESNQTNEEVDGSLALNSKSDLGLDYAEVGQVAIESSENRD